MIEEQIQEKAWVAKGTEMLDSSKLYSDSGGKYPLCETETCLFHLYPRSRTSPVARQKMGVTFKVKGTGTVAIKTSMNGMDSVVKLERALHCPDISANLISVSRLDKDGWKVVYGGQKVTFIDPNGTPQFDGELVGDLYAINGTLIHHSSTAP